METVNQGYFELTVIAFYAPTEDTEEGVKDAFYDQARQ